jgi:hypothetical protein
VNGGRHGIPFLCPRNGNRQRAFLHLHESITVGRSVREWRTYPMSDHLPMWIEFGIDDGITYLKSQRKLTD